MKPCVSVCRRGRADVSQAAARFPRGYIQFFMRTCGLQQLPAWTAMEQAAASVRGVSGPALFCEACFHTRLTNKAKLASWASELPACARQHQLVLPFVEVKAEPVRSLLSPFPTLGGNGAPASALATPLISQDQSSTCSLLKPVEQDLQRLNENLMQIIGAENPLLMAAAEQIFGASGKKIRPALVFLVSYATAQLTGLGDITPQHCKLAEITEMIHTASLIHDDVLDDSNIRRGKDTVNQVFGTKVAVLAGDFIFAQTSWLLANLENLEVIKLISQVIKDFASGELKQATNLYNCDITLQDYLRKSYCKTASLVAASTKGAAIFSRTNTNVKEKMYDYGKNLGLAFQIVDDILDFTRSSTELGKPAGSDLRKGNLTVPVLYALEKEASLRKLIQSEFLDQKNLEAAIKLVHQSGAIEKAHRLAREKGEVAVDCLSCLPQGPMKTSLEGMVEYVLDRLH